MTEESDDHGIRKEADLHRFAIAGVMREAYLKMQYEYERWMTYNLKSDYPAMGTLHSIARTQARGQPEILKGYEKKFHELNLRYGNVEDRRWEMRPEEARERKKILENLLYDLGPTRIDERHAPPQYKVYDESYSIDGRQLVWDFFQTRLKENRNLVILFTGQVGGGKSWASISIADYLVPNLKLGFDLQGLVFDIPSFIQFVKDGKPGDVLILDEAGIAAGSRDALTKGSKTLSKVIQSIRYLQYCTIFTLPNVNFLDKQIRLMVDLVFQHDQGMKQGVFRVLTIRLTDDGKGVEYGPLIYKGRIVRTAYFPLPRPALIDDYEKVRREHNIAQLTELQEGLGDIKKGGKETKGDMRGKNPNSRKNLRRFTRSDRNE